MITRNKYLSVLLFVLIPFSAAAKPKTYGNAIITRLISVYDGDTFRADIQGYPEVCGINMPIRIYGIDTPEIRDKNPKIKEFAKKAKEYTKKRLQEAKKIVLKDIQRGKYFRFVADVEVDGVSLREELIKAGLAKPYDGGKKEKWTDKDIKSGM